MIELLQELAKQHGLTLWVQCDCPEPFGYALWRRDDDGNSDIIAVGDTWGECCDVASQEMAAWR
jgi:hypothetical protein